MSLEMAHKVIVPPKKNYIPQFLKQRDINSYYSGLNESSLAPTSNGWTVDNTVPLKVHKIEIFFGFDFEICIISLLVM